MTTVTPDIITPTLPETITEGAVILHKGIEFTVAAVTRIGRTYHFTTTSDDVLSFGSNDQVATVL